MAKTFTVKARFTAEDKASAPIKKVETRFQKLTSTIKSSAAAQIAAFGGVVVALRAMVRFFTDSIEKANKQEIAVNQLNAALASLGPTADSVSKSLQDQAAALQKVTTFGDEAVIEVQTMIASFVKNEDQIKAATAATLDFAVANGIDLKGAAALVAKTLGSTTNALTRYGIEVKGAVGSTERLSSLVDNVADKFGGRAAAAVDTFAGATEQLGNAFGDLQEKIAANLTQNKELIADINDLTEAMSDAGPEVVKWSARLVDLSGALVKTVAATGEAGGFVQLFVDELIEAGTKTDELAISQKALEATAKRYGVTVDALTVALKDGTAAQLAQEAATRRANQELAEAKEKADEAAEALKKLSEDAVKETTTAMEDLAKALGVVTSIELEEELATLEKNFRLVAASTFGASTEFASYARGVEAETSNLRARIESLKGGMGDLKDTTEEAVPAAKQLADEFVRGAEAADAEGLALRRLKADTEALIGPTQQLINGRIVLFDQLGRRVGSRLARTPGPADSGLGLAQFGTGGLFSRNPDTTTDSRGTIIG